YRRRGGLVGGGLVSGGLVGGGREGRRGFRGRGALFCERCFGALFRECSGPRRRRVAEGLERVVPDAPQDGEIEVVAQVAAQVEKDQGLAGAAGGADQRTLLFRIDVAAVGDEPRHHRLLAFLGVLRVGDQQQPVAARRERDVVELDLVAEVPGERRAGGIGALGGLAALALRLLVVPVLAQPRGQAQLLALQEVSRLLLGRVLGQAEGGGLADQARTEVIDDDRLLDAE